MPCMLRRRQDWHVLPWFGFGADNCRHDCTPCGVSGKDNCQWRAMVSTVPNTFAQTPCDCVIVSCSSMHWIAVGTNVVRIPGCYKPQTKLDCLTQLHIRLRLLGFGPNLLFFHVLYCPLPPVSLSLMPSSLVPKASQTWVADIALSSSFHINRAVPVRETCADESLEVYSRDHAIDLRLMCAVKQRTVTVKHLA